MSTREQAEEGFSISAQRQRLTAYCESQGWEIVEFFVDEGKSAKDTNRDDLKRMKKFIENGLIDVVLVYRLDRLTRSVLDLYELLKFFDKHDCRFKSATEVYDTTTAMGRLFITLVAALAQWERENLGERVSMGMAEKARQGKWSNALTPYGYYLDNNRELAINDEQAEVVKWIYKKYLNGWGMKRIAKALNQSGVPSRKEKSWFDAVVQYILSNPIYMGNMRWHYRTQKENYFEVEGSAPPIIDEETFEKVQALRKARHVVHPRRATSPFVFSGIAKCGKCGSPMSGKYGSPNKSGRYAKRYQCSKKPHGLCDAPTVAGEYIERQFLKMLQDWDVSSEAHEEAAAGIETEWDEKYIESLKKELTAIENRRKKWQYAWANETIKDEEFTERMKEENEKEKHIKTELETHEKAVPDGKLGTDEMAKVLSDLRSNWDVMETEEKKSFLQLFFKSFTVRRINNKRSPDCIQIEDVELY